MNRLGRVGIAVVLLAGVLWAGGVAEAGRLLPPVTVCVDASSGVVSRVASSEKYVGGAQTWSASQSAPLLCWNASSLDPQVGTRKVSVAPLRAVPVDEVLLLCAGGKFGVLSWPVTGSCRSGNKPIWVRSDATPTTVATDTSTTSTTSTPTAATAVVVPSVSLTATWIQSITFPKAVTVTANVAGTIYFAEGAFVVKTVSDITSAPSYRWASGTVTSANTPTSIAIDVDALTNGYYRVYVADSQGVLSAPATKIVTISIPRASTATTTSTTSTTVALTCATGGVCALGDTGPGGGRVFYVQASGGTFACGATLVSTCKYLEAAPTSDTRAWADFPYAWSGNTTTEIGATAQGTAVGTGYKNTLAMVAQSPGGNTPGRAGMMARAYLGPNNLTDWYLPSKDELNQMCKWQRGVAWTSDATVCTGGILNSGTGASGFSADYYWSSSEYAVNDAWYQSFSNGSQNTNFKDSTYYVRPVRAFG